MDKFDYRYAEGKWTIKEIIQHLISRNVFFLVGQMRISRNDQMAGFDENDYVIHSDANERNYKDC
jgi:hypothetical protein